MPGRRASSETERGPWASHPRAPRARARLLGVAGVPHMPLTATTQQLSSARPLLAPSPSSLQVVKRASGEPSPLSHPPLGGVPWGWAAYVFPGESGGQGGTPLSPAWPSG